jgi:ribosomal protein S4
VSRSSGFERRVRDVLISAQVADNPRDARWLILTGRVWVDGIKETRPNVYLSTGEHKIEVSTNGGMVRICAKGDGLDSRV